MQYIPASAPQQLGIEASGCRVVVVGRHVRLAAPACGELRDGWLRLGPPVAGEPEWVAYDIPADTAVVAIAARDGAAVDVPDTLALSLDDVELCAARGSTLHVAPFRVAALVASASLGSTIHGDISCARASRYADATSRLPRVHVEPSMD